ncbi:conserved phage C-terminal domain-containing protein [Paraclostridium bifermentans]|uniref:conserved phage C-terminal domain-containing protein n=1 Tax=Paraclostridium bifermentans TaxID=1490 RepID=UPI00387B6D88
MKLLKDIRKKDWFFVENELIDRDDLTIYEKMIYIVLARHSNDSSCCFPSYKTIAMKAGCSDRKVMKTIESLEEKKLICKKERKTSNNKQMSNMYFIMSAKNSDISSEQGSPIPVNEVHSIGEQGSPIPMNEVHPNNTNNNNTNITTYSLVINRLNEVCNKNYKSSTPKTKKLIQARLNENFALEDFYKVIDLKSKEWLGTEMEKYLRPETLFGNKFEGYLNEKVSTKNEIENIDDEFIPELQFETLK